MLPPFRVDTAIEAAGGVSGRGSQRAIELREPDKPLLNVDLVKFRRLGDVTMNPMLHEGQTVYVPSRGPTCDVIGEVWRTGTYEILPEETVMDLIALAGGFTTHAKTDEIVLEKLRENEVTITKMDEAFAKTAIVRDSDVIVVPDQRSFPGAEFVRVQGGGGRAPR